MTQYKTVIIPTPCDDTGVSHNDIANAITLAITEQAKDGWEITLAQEMDSSNNKGLIANLFGSKKKEKHTMLVFKKEEKKPEPEPAKEFDYDRFEEIVSKGVDYDRFAHLMKKAVSETEVTISKKSFEGLKFTLPTPALPMGEGEPQQATFLIGDKAPTKALPNKDGEGELTEEEEKNRAIAKVLYDIFMKNKGKGISFEEIMKEGEGKLPEGTTEKEVGAVLMTLVEYKKVKKEKGLYSF